MVMVEVDILSLRCSPIYICAHHAHNPQPLSSELETFFINVSAEKGRCDINTQMKGR